MNYPIPHLLKFPLLTPTGIYRYLWQFCIVQAMASAPVQVSVLAQCGTPNTPPSHAAAPTAAAVALVVHASSNSEGFLTKLSRCVSPSRRTTWNAPVPTAMVWPMMMHSLTPWIWSTFLSTAA